MTSLPMRLHVPSAARCHLPSDTIFVGPRSRWANPFRTSRHRNRFDVTLDFTAHLNAMTPAAREAYLAPLRGKHLACTCHKRHYCHADILIQACIELDKAVAR